MTYESFEYDVCLKLAERLNISLEESQDIIDAQESAMLKCFYDETSSEETAELIDEISIVNHHSFTN